MNIIQIINLVYVAISYNNTRSDYPIIQRKGKLAYIRIIKHKYVGAKYIDKETGAKTNLVMSCIKLIKSFHTLLKK